MVKIYCFVNPIDGNVFYVGATSFCPKSRLSAQISKPSNTELNRILGFIKLMGKRPELIVLEEDIEHKDASFFENWYMELFKSFGFRLANKRLSDYTQVKRDFSID